MANAPWPLEELFLSGNHLSAAAAAAALVALSRHVGLRCLDVPLGEAGAALLARRPWPRLKNLRLFACSLGNAGIAALARGAWPALEVLHLSGNFSARPALEDARRWAPALVELIQF